MARESFYDQIAANRRNSLLMAGVVVALLGLLGFTIGWAVFGEPAGGLVATGGRFISRVLITELQDPGLILRWQLAYANIICNDSLLGQIPSERALIFRHLHYPLMHDAGAGGTINHALDETRLIGHGAHGIGGNCPPAKLVCQLQARTGHLQQ